MKWLISLFALTTVLYSPNAYSSFSDNAEDRMYVLKDNVTGCYYFRTRSSESSTYRRLSADGSTHLCDDKPLGNRQIFNRHDTGSFYVYTDRETGCSYISGDFNNSGLIPRRTKTGDIYCNGTK